MSLENALKIYETRTFINKENESGSGGAKFYAVSGSRMLVTVAVLAIDLGATLTVYVDNSFDDSLQYETLETIAATAVGQIKRTVVDFNRLFNIRYAVTGGSATFKVAISLNDNSPDLSNVTINVEAKLDELKALVDQLEAYTDGLEGLLTTLGAVSATAAKQDVGNSSLASIDGKVATETTLNLAVTELQAIKGYVDQLEGFTDGIEALLTSIGSSVATESTLAAAVSELQAIKGFVDGLEGFTDGLEAAVSTLNGLVATAAKQDVGNASLASIDTKVATDVTLAQAVSELQAIKGYVDGLEGLISALNGLVATAAKQDIGNASLASIDTKVATETTLASAVTELQAIKGYVDQLEGFTDGLESLLTTLNSLVATAARQDIGNASLASIDTKIEKIGSDIRTVNPTQLPASLGQKVMASSTSVTVASDQSPVAVKLTSAEFPTFTRVDVSSFTTGVGGNSAAFDTAGMGCLTYEADVTAISGSGAAIQLWVDVSEDGVNWNEYVNSVRITSVTRIRHQRMVIGARYYRYRWTVIGTTPSFTFSIITTAKAYLPRRNVSVHRYADIDVGTVGNASSAFSAADSTTVSLSITRSSDGGSQALYRLQASNDRINWVDISASISQPAGATTLNELQQKAFRFYRVKIVTASNLSATCDLFWAATG